MSESSFSKTFTKGVGRRILVLFFVAAIVPMLFTAGLAFYEFSRGLEQHTATTLKDSAKEYGVEILTRLELATEKSAEVVRIVEDAGVIAVSEYEYLLSDFEAIWILGESDSPTMYFGDALVGPSGSINDIRNVPVGDTRLLLTAQNELVLLRSAAGGGGAKAVIAFRLIAERIWGPREKLPYSTEFCVFSTGGVALYCTTAVDASIHSSLVLAGVENRGSIFGEWVHQDETHFAALWQLFLRAKFGADALDIIALQPKAFAMQSGTDFRRVFIPAIVLVLVLVGVLTLNLIGRSLVPLQHLTIAARQVAGGNLASRVRVRTGDEFEWLAEAFNKMAARLEGQILTLRAMSGIDRMILGGTNFEEVSEDVVGHLASLTKCEVAAVIACDPDSPNMGTMISSHSGDTCCHERIVLPVDVGHRWCQPRQVSLHDADLTDAPYANRFRSYGQNYVVIIPVVLSDELKGVLLLGYTAQHNMTQGGTQRCIDLAGRFAVALASVKRGEALYRQAHFDDLTNLPNRQLLKDRLEQHLASARVNKHSGALLFLDLDHFKEINDVYGHSVGDVVLTQASERIISEVRGRDTVARLGGDEFVVVLPDVRNDSIVVATAKRLLKKMSEGFTVQTTEHYVSVSIGIVMFPDDGATVETLLKNADAAMYRAKEAGRGRFEFFSEGFNAESRRKIDLERELRSAFHDRELEVHYQPQVDIATGSISGAEALIRWNRGQKGEVLPDEFIPLAEESDLIVEIGSWVIERACEDLCSLLDKHIHPGPMSINVSARQLADERFVDAVMDPIRRFDIHPGYIQLEITETTVAQNRDTAIAKLESLRTEGVRVAIDDFGTGYSSLGYLQQMPFDVIKIDKSFIDRIGTSETADNICKTIIKMAEQLGKESIAEGVEEQSQLDFLRENGCDFVQGFLYSAALRKDEFLAFVEKQDFHTQRRKALEIIK